MKKWMKRWFTGAFLFGTGVAGANAQIGVVFRDDFTGSVLQSGWVTSVAGGGVAQGTATVSSGELYFSKDINYGGGHAYLWYTNQVLNPTTLADPSHYYRITYYGLRFSDGYINDAHAQIAPTNALATFAGPGWRIQGGAGRIARGWVADGVGSTLTPNSFSVDETTPVDMAIEWGYNGTPGSGFVQWLTNGVVIARVNADYYDGKVLQLVNEQGPIPTQSLIMDAVQIEILPEPSALAMTLLGGLSLLRLRRRT